MKPKAHHISYRLTEAFSPLVQDYLTGESLAGFYSFPPEKERLKDLMASRRRFMVNRLLLVDRLRKDYQGKNVHARVSANIDSLLSENTFTVCTAHQPAIFTGHLYFIYKILHAVKTADELNRDFPDSHFVPVFYMGSEDADLDELGSFHLNGQHYRWETGQTGAVGRMRVDEGLLKLIDVIRGQLIGQPFGGDLLGLLEKCYRPGSTIQEASFDLLNELFGEWGLVVLLPDHQDFKAAFAAEMGKEIEEGLSAKALFGTLQKFPDVYKPQAAGRDVNLFYLTENRRERISREGNDIRLMESGELKPEASWKEELKIHPDRFSPNVILRPVFQEKLLPNIIFIGGGSELAYWLELKEVFEAFAVHYPMILLRNSFMLVPEDMAGAVRSLGFELNDMFKSQKHLTDIIVRNHTILKIDLAHEKERLSGLYRDVTHFAGSVDKSLAGHVSALGTQALKKIENLEKKMMRAEKRKYNEEIIRLQKIKDRLFPQGALQERVENFLPYYALLGKAFLEVIYEYSGSFDQQFCTIEFS